LSSHIQYPDDAWELLSPTLTDTRKQRLLQVAAGRTRRIRLVIQDVHQPHNISACMRSAEALGVQDVDVVTMDSRFRPSTAARGVEDWLTIRRHRDVATCVKSLRASGYKIAAGIPQKNALPLHELPVDQPIAVLFGNEHAGLHPDWSSHVDLPFTIPMAGMVESLNISVSAAITLQHLTYAARNQLAPKCYYLSAKDQQELLGEWVCRQRRS
jgi:tRNA (guanosine-2'-O-)-methyltransferase